MSEIRIVLCALSAIILGALLSWGSITLTSHHYERIMASQQVARDQVVQRAEADVIAAQAAQREAENRADEETQKREQADSVTRDTVVGGLRSLEAAVRARILPSPMGNPGSIQGTQPGPAGDSGLPVLLARFNASFDRLISACQHESEERAAILSLEPKVKP